MNSTSIRGTALSTRLRTSSITAKMSRSRSPWGFSRATMSPVFWPVANIPISAPVRLAVAVISGVESMIRSTMWSCRSVSSSRVPVGVR